MQNRLNYHKYSVIIGTPITNSLTDAFVMQLYLQPHRLYELMLHRFDGWVGMFAEKASDFKIDIDTSSYRLVTRFSKFHNLPELTALLAEITDFHIVGCGDGLPKLNGRINCVLKKPSELADYLKEIGDRADRIRYGKIDRRTDNMLKITTDVRKAALDIRLVGYNKSTSEITKTECCAENVYKIYKGSEKATQVIFCDISVPKQGFNIYDELKSVLVSRGADANDIFFIHDAKTESERTTLFEKVRNGDVRILIGSTAKLGLDVNIQDRLLGLHHLDVPWRPADMTQREGRILRQGNTNKEVFIYRYITEGSFDTYSWQLLETKQKFINAVLSGKLSQRSENDVENTVLDYAEVKALAIEDPLMKKRVEAANALNKYISLQQAVSENRSLLSYEYSSIPAKIKTAQEKLNRLCEKKTLSKAQALNKERLKRYINALKERMRHIEAEFEENTDYINEIIKYKNILTKIDTELGIENNF